MLYFLCWVSHFSPLCWAALCCVFYAECHKYARYAGCHNAVSFMLSVINKPVIVVVIMLCLLCSVSHLCLLCWVSFYRMSWRPDTKLCWSRSTFFLPLSLQLWFYLFRNSFFPSGRFRTLDLRITSRVVYLCATGYKKSYTKTFYIFIKYLNQNYNETGLMDIQGPVS